MVFLQKRKSRKATEALLNHYYSIPDYQQATINKIFTPIITLFQKI